MDNCRGALGGLSDDDPMSFDDLPSDWPNRPLTDPRLVADVLDLVVFEKDRRAGALSILMCDEDGRLVQPVTISELDPAATQEQRVRCLETLVEAMRGTGAMLLALARPDGLSVTEADRAWLRAAETACGDEVRLLGLHIVTCHGSREVPRTA